MDEGTRKKEGYERGGRGELERMIGRATEVRMGGREWGRGGRRRGWWQDDWKQEEEEKAEASVE